MLVPFRLTTLGELSLRCGGERYAGPAAQRRRLAILAVVASAGARGVRRDRLLTLFWPDEHPERARHALDQALSQTRGRSVEERFITGVGALRLDARLVTTDLAELAAAADAPERAVALYTGPFLDGFRLPDAPAFAQWVDEERARHAAEHARRLDVLAQRAERAGDPGAAVPWLLRFLAAEPLSDVAAERLVRALLTVGDWARAMDEARRHVARVRAELGTPPGPNFMQLVAQLRAIPASRPPGPDGNAVRAGADARGEDAGHASASGLTWRERREATARARLLRALGGRYDLGALLADGTVWARYAAYDRHAGVRVEVHSAQPAAAALADAETFVGTLRRLVSLADPHIVSVLDVGAREDTLFYVSAPTAGDSLRDRLRRDGSLGIADAARIARDVAAGLAAAYAHGVLHLDLRPKHVAPGVGGTRRATVAKIGLVAALQGSDGPGRRDGGSEHSPSALLAFGDPAYLSPEQLGLSGLADGRSDVYALGGLLFEMLAGEPPFGRTLALAMRKTAQPAPPLGTWREDVPPGIQQVVARCLARMPADRYGSADEVRAALDTILAALERAG